MKRRNLAIGLGCIAGLTAGIAAGIRFVPPPPPPLAAGEVAAALREHILVDPSGEPTSIPIGARRLLINFWATWCPPCIHEMPILDEAAKSGSLAIYGLAVDDLDAVAGFLQERPVSYPIQVAGLNGGLRLARALGNDVGAMPYSVMIDEQGKLGATLAGNFADVSEVTEFFAQ